jgi:hypothetical protein
VEGATAEAKGDAAALEESSGATGVLAGALGERPAGAEDGAGASAGPQASDVTSSRMMARTVTIRRQLAAP